MQGQFKYVPGVKRKTESPVRSIMRGDIGAAEFSYNDLKSNCEYLPEFMCKVDDMSIMNNILGELQAHNPVRWNHHYKYDTCEFSETFDDVVQKLSDHFKMRVCAARLNYYADGTDYKTFHRDSHIGSENYTVGVSFGATRDLVFKHEKTGKTFTFNQKNGDVFAFSSSLNKDFLHGVPRAGKHVGKRISLIIWGEINLNK